MINLLYQGEVTLFALILIALVISLSFHEFGHAYVAKRFGDDTAERAGRLTVNPLAHIDPMGLVMVMLIGFGYAKPVPTDPRNFTSRWADLLVAAAGPGMNLLVAVVTVNAYMLGLRLGFDVLAQPGPEIFVTYLTLINLVLMVFNLIPLGALDGHYMLPYFLPRRLAQLYRYYNARYGNYALLALVLLAVLGLPVFRVVFSVGEALIPMIRFL